MISEVGVNVSSSLKALYPTSTKVPCGKNPQQVKYRYEKSININNKLINGVC